MGLIRRLPGSWKDYLWIIAGSILTAFSINVFLVPYKIAPGGVSGIATVIHYLTGGKFPVGLAMLLLNVPLFIAGMKFIGNRFVIRTFFGTIFLSFAIDALEPLSNRLVEKYLVSPVQSVSNPDLLLYSIFGGFIMGVGLGMVFRSGATTGGTDLAARILHSFVPNSTIGQLLLVIDTSIIVFAGIAFQSFQLALYAIVTLFVSSRVIDAMLEGVNFAKVVYIISDHSDIIAEKIMKELDRGVTALKGVGMYTGKDKKVLLCVIDRGQIQPLKAIVASVDKRAFMFLADIREVLGEGFRSYEQN